jgi:hypothetical protein
LLQRQHTNETTQTERESDAKRAEMMRVGKKEKGERDQSF